MPIIELQPIPEKQIKGRTMGGVDFFRRLFNNLGIRVSKRALRSDDFETKVQGWEIKSDGNAEFTGKITIGGLEYSKDVIYTIFESIDGWVKSGLGTKNAGLGEMSLDTTSASGYIADIHFETFGEGDAINFSKNPYFQTSVKLSSSTNQTAYFANGAYDSDGFGFKISNGTLYSYTVVNDIEYTTEITGITLTNWNTYKAVYDSGTDIKFYVNNVLKVTTTTNLPTDPNGAERFRYRITNTAAERKYLFAKYLLLVQDF